MLLPSEDANFAYSPAARRRPVVTGSARHSLEQAFVSFTHVAGALENSYLELQGKVRRLRQELEETNRDLACSLEENERMRLYLKRILKGLPCGVLVFDQKGCLRIANPEARRLLAIEPNLALQTSPQLPEALQRLRAEISLEGPAVEQEWSLEGPEGKRHFAVTRTSLPGGNGSGRESIFILRDTTEEKNLEQEREAVRHMQALAEMATLLAHEIRNPLGSLELFAGLLADATEEHTEIRNWVDHLQAGLRTISATVNNVLQFHSPPAPCWTSASRGTALSRAFSATARPCRWGKSRWRPSPTCRACCVTATTTSWPASPPASPTSACRARADAARFRGEHSSSPTWILPGNFPGSSWRSARSKLTPGRLPPLTRSPRKRST